jgi:signal transduction histidine kinase
VAIAHGLLRRQTLAGWVAVGALAVLHHDLLAIQADPGAVAAIGSGGVRLLGMVAMLLGVYHHMEQGHSDLERRLHAAYASLDVMKRARASRMHEAEEKLHQARSALAAIDLAVQTLPADPELRDALTSELSLLRRLVTPASAVPAPFRIADAIVGVVAAERLYGVDVAVSVPPGLNAFGDLSGTAEIMQTLLENARFHAPGAAIEVRAARVGDVVEIAIVDDGPGIDPELDVFAPGVSGGRGQGLGLTIAARIAQGQGGRLSVDRSVEIGTRFVLTLPAGSGDRAHQLDDVGGASNRRGAAQAGSFYHLGSAAAVTDRDDDV